MDPLLCYPDPLPIELQKVLAQAGYPFIGIASANAMSDREPEDGWAGAVVSAATTNPETAMSAPVTLRE